MCTGSPFIVLNKFYFSLRTVDVISNQDRTFVGVGGCEVVHCLDPFQGFLSEGAIEKLCPIVRGHNDFTVLTTNQLGMIDDG